jgi:predicted RNase H-like HicB family nuclease
MKFPVTLTPDQEDGGYVVSFRDIPEAITQGDTVNEALSMAKEALELAIEFYFDKRSSEDDSLASVYSVSEKYRWLMELTGEGESYVKFCFKTELENPQRQKLAPCFMPNGAIYILKGSTMESNVYRKNTLPYVMTEEDSIDIDTIQEFNAAVSRLMAVRLVAPEKPK